MFNDCFTTVRSVAGFPLRTVMSVNDLEELLLTSAGFG